MHKSQVSHFAGLHFAQFEMYLISSVYATLVVAVLSSCVLKYILLNKTCISVKDGSLKIFGITNTFAWFEFYESGLRLKDHGEMWVPE